MSAALKRGFDVATAVIGLLMLAPLLGVIGLLVRLDSPGPALFRQTRVGRFGRPFRIFKFRTMQVALEPQGPLVTGGADRRITRLGRWLRRLKFDELPQLLNVINGDMSLVGPRPEVERFVACWPDDLRPLILSVRPGITDPASLEYFEEATLLERSLDVEKAYVDEVLPRKVAIYARYVRTRSFRGDLRVVVRTLFRIAGAHPSAHETRS